MATTWDSTYEGLPNSSSLVGNTYTVITGLKGAIRDRVGLEHQFELAADSQQGRHRMGSARGWVDDAAPPTAVASVYPISTSGEDVKIQNVGRMWYDSTTGILWICDGQRLRTVLTMTDNPADGTHIVIGDTTYNFLNTLNSTVCVKREASAALTMRNLMAAINFSGGLGTYYAGITAVDPAVFATNYVSSPVSITLWSVALDTVTVTTPSITVTPPANSSINPTSMTTALSWVEASKMRIDADSPALAGRALKTKVIAMARGVGPASWTGTHGILGAATEGRIVRVTLRRSSGDAMLTIPGNFEITDTAVTTQALFILNEEVTGLIIDTTEYTNLQAVITYIE